MQSLVHPYINWKDFFKRRLTTVGTFFLSGHRKSEKAEVEIYSSLIPGFKTTVEVGFESPQRLLFLHILNPFTPALNRQQEGYFFGENDFYPHFDQNGTGLEFDDFNIRGIDDYLSHRFKGSETVYLRDGKVVKSILKSDTLPWTHGTMTFHFEKIVSISTANEFSGEEVVYDKTIEIDLCEVYPGTNRS
jgi:hypothetical protein